MENNFDKIFGDEDEEIKYDEDLECNEKFIPFKKSFYDSHQIKFFKYDKKYDIFEITYLINKKYYKEYLTSKFFKENKSIFEIFFKFNQEKYEAISKSKKVDKKSFINFNFLRYRLLVAIYIHKKDIDVDSIPNNKFFNYFITNKNFLNFIKEADFNNPLNYGFTF